MSSSPPRVPRNNCLDTSHVMDDEETTPKKKSRPNAEMTEGDYREKHSDPTDDEEDEEGGAMYK